MKGAPACPRVYGITHLPLFLPHLPLYVLTISFLYDIFYGPRCCTNALLYLPSRPLTISPHSSAQLHISWNTMACSMFLWQLVRTPTRHSTHRRDSPWLYPVYGKTPTTNYLHIKSIRACAQATETETANLPTLLFRYLLRIGVPRWKHGDHSPLDSRISGLRNVWRHLIQQPRGQDPSS